MTTVISIAAAPLILYVVIKMIQSLTHLGWLNLKPITDRWRFPPRTFAIGTLFIIANAYPMTMGMFQDRIVNGDPWTYNLLVYPYWLLILVVAQFVPFLLLCDLSKLPLRRIFTAHRDRWRSIESYCVVGMFAIGTLYVGGRIYHDTCMVSVSEMDLSIRDLPPDLEGFTIAHISDLQADPLTTDERMQQYVNEINGLKPDLVLFTGDLITRGTRYIDAGARMMGRIVASQGVIACMGDHDTWSGPEEIARALRANGVVVLENEHHVVTADSSKLVVSGLTSTYRSRRSSRVNVADLAATRPDAHVSIMMAHQPRAHVVESEALEPYHLFCGGHTHGGQVVVGWFDWIFTPVLSESPYLTGAYSVGDLAVSINNGLGLTMAPLRFQAPAEVTIIRLQRGI